MAIRHLRFARQTPDNAPMDKMDGLDAFEYSLAVKNKGRPPRSWRWEIYTAGKSKPVQQSDFFETMSEATRAGKAALAELRGRAV
jgi:hypothetical protein